MNLGLVHTQRRRFAEAVPFLERARPHHRAALSASPRSPAYRQSYRNNLRTLSQSRLGLADHAELAEAAGELARFGYDPANATSAEHTEVRVERWYDAADFFPMRYPRNPPPSLYPARPS